MARYSNFLRHKVEVHYRAGDIVLPASGIFVADSGRSIFLEQHLMQRGQQKHFRWEIPYQYIVRLEEVPDPAEDSGTVGAPRALAMSPEALLPNGGEPRCSSTLGNSSGAAPSVLPL